MHFGKCLVSISGMCFVKTETDWAQIHVLANMQLRMATRRYAELRAKASSEEATSPRSPVTPPTSHSAHTPPARTRSAVASLKQQWEQRAANTAASGRRIVFYDS